MIHTGDCLEVMPTLDAESIDAIVTDPPYGLSFMGRDWDHGSPGVPFWQAALRVAKPGAHLLAFGGTRTYHRLACAIEDAGWEVRDCLVWAYASGFPKSLDVSKAIDKAAGAEREVVGQQRQQQGPQSVTRRATQSAQGYRPDGDEFGQLAGESYAITAPATPEAARWQGWGTALKPAWEPIILARKPLRGTVAANVLAHGTGALNIDGCRIGTTDPHPAGRWPANLILTDPIFDGGLDSNGEPRWPGVVGGGEAGAAGQVRRQNATSAFGGGGGDIDFPFYGDSGTYSRFFLIPKAARSDREPVLGGLERSERTTSHVDFGREDPFGENITRSTARANIHPTVKPLDLMRHLVRLVTPPGGTVLDPFLGSGTTALAAEMEGFAWIGIEKEAEYVRIAEARLNGTQRGLGIA